MDDKIESVTFFKQINYSTQVFEKNLGPASVMSISLPRVKFLEKDGDYKPGWAVDVAKINQLEEPKNVTPEQKRLIIKTTVRRRSMDAGIYEISELEQKVHDLIEQGKTKQEICQLLNKRPSAVGGAIGRFKAKTLAKLNKK